MTIGIHSLCMHIRLATTNRCKFKNNERTTKSVWTLQGGSYQSTKVLSPAMIVNTWVCNVHMTFLNKVIHFLVCGGFVGIFWLNDFNHARDLTFNSCKKHGRFEWMNIAYAQWNQFQANKYTNIKLQNTQNSSMAPKNTKFHACFHATIKNRYVHVHLPNN